MSKPLNIAYVSLYDATDIRVWSGSVYFIAKSLEQQGCRLTHVDQLQQGRLFFNKAVNRLVGFTGNAAPMPEERSTRMAQRFARQVEQELMRGQHDVVFSPSSIPLALLRTPKPKVFYTDATFADMLEQYPEFGDYPAALIAEGHELERAALANCDLAIYASDWAARSAVDKYGADPAKVRVFPLGSNFEVEPGMDAVEKAIAARPMDRCELLFLGVSWVRKGGPLALEVTETLNAMGMPTTLTVIGCEPPEGVNSPFIRQLPFINKSTKAGQLRLISHLLHSHFLLLPSIAECFGIVHAEASSMGVPSFARNVGGVANAVREGRNGHLFPADAGAAPYAEAIMRLMREPGAYGRLAHSALLEQRRELNWNTTGERIVSELSMLVSRALRA